MMQLQLTSLGTSLLKSAQSIGRLAKDTGARAYLAGGCVRDLILKRKVEDLDVMIEGDAMAVAKRFSTLHKGKAVVYKQFATASVALPAGGSVDFATLRHETYPSPGALPVIGRGTIEQDLHRRDFTINAMIVSLEPESFGKLFDLFGGQDDIKGKVIRVLHERSFIDDPTRILRAVRFEQRFRFCIEPETLRLLRSAVRAGAIDTVKPQRLFEEFRKNLKENTVGENLARLKGLNVLKAIDVRFSFSRKQEEMLERAQISLTWVRKNLPDLSDESSWLVAWMVLCDGMSLMDATKVMDRFAFRTSDRNKVLSARSSLKGIKSLDRKDHNARQAFFLMRGKAPEELMYFDARSASGRLRAMIRTYFLKWRHVSIKINGDDLKRLGIPSGKIYKTILDAVLACVLEGRLKGRSEQLAYARRFDQQNKG